MTARLHTLLAGLASALLCALSLGGRLFYLLAYTLLLMLAFALVSVLWALAGLDVKQSLDSPRAERGGDVMLNLTVRLSSPLPVAPLEVRLALPGGEGAFSLAARLFRPLTAAFPCPLRHVGAFQLGASRVYVSDVFGLLRLGRRLRGPLPRALSLPRPFPVDRLAFPPQDDGQMSMNQSGEDVTSPEDTRSYREGDQMKRIHWKLSQRAGELIVRRFEVPAPPDTLILLDVNAPRAAEGVEDGRARLTDALCETALSAAKEQMEGRHPVRVPLYSSRGGEFHADSAGQLPLLKEELALQPFERGGPFHEILNVELRRMRRTGATIVITTRLSADIVEAVKNIRRSGPSVRFYFVSFEPEKEEYRPYIARMQRHLVEVCYVTPA